MHSTLAIAAVTHSTELRLIPAIVLGGTAAVVFIGALWVLLACLRVIQDPRP